ncbi:ACP S-malonyltransferase [Desmospora activa]|uniref:[acyl-carrier-protein] S-malonyltransferase n=1 Tax=Desmospora activa DSM 45169 TaxID=1121389 RepID=A0A2T4ZAC7_9BACL|nr:ACP S-malonyltransferase [Desmospora activa]PTM58843.1 [acyl-carrier-protein] S-malonyltransferase [Desmospora activa DSM 45169]
MTKTAVLFPSQMNIDPNEYRALFDQVPIMQNRFAEASQILGFDLVEAFFSDDLDEVNRGIVARPAIVSISAALYEWAQDYIPSPSYLAGLSLGQLTAAHISGALTFSDLVRMTYTMASLEEKHFADKDYGVHFFYNIDIDKLLGVMEEMESKGHYLKACAYTASNQMIVCGSLSSMGELNLRVLELGGIGVEIPYGPPAHCPLMEAVKREFSRNWYYADDVKKPKIPLICNISTKVLDHPNKICNALIEQYTMTVKWTQTIEKMAALGVKRLVIIGPGNFIYKSLGFIPVSFEVECYLGLHDMLEKSAARRMSE